MRDGMYLRGRRQALPADQAAYTGKPKKPEAAWWTLTMALCMGAMALWGVVRLLGRGRGRHG